MPLNVKLLERVKAHILAEPKRLWMDDWRRMGKPGQFIDGCGNQECCHGTTRFAACGTAACIAGWACLLSRKAEPPAGYNFKHHGARLLGIKDNVDDLFVVEFWPRPMAEAFRRASTARARAKVTAQRIDAFIAERAGEVSR